MKLHIFILSILLVFLCQTVKSSTIPETITYDTWMGHKIKYQLEFHGREDAQRFKIFQKNARELRKFQLLLNYEVSLGPTAHMTTDEYELQYTGCLTPRKVIHKNKRYSFRKLKHIRQNLENIPANLDYRANYSSVRRVSNQENCGSCWAFSSVGSVETNMQIKYGNDIILSEQQLVDCEHLSPNDNGCNGGDMDNALYYIQKYGVEEAKYYPYTAMDGECMANDSYKKYTIKGHISIKDDQGAIKVALNKYGPLSAAIYASSKGFRYYSHGIYDGADCFSSPDKLNHGILIIGYGEVNGETYYILRNSWGESWGDFGFMKISNKYGACGIQYYVLAPIV